jgi:hypothetical protein
VLPVPVLKSDASGVELVLLSVHTSNVPKSKQAAPAIAGEAKIAHDAQKTRANHIETS